MSPDQAFIAEKKEWLARAGQYKDGCDCPQCLPWRRIFDLAEQASSRKPTFVDAFSAPFRKAAS